MKDRSSSNVPYRMLSEQEQNDLDQNNEDLTSKELSHVSKRNEETSTFRDTMIGSACIALGQILFGTNDALVKFSKLRVDQLLFFRFLIQFSIAAIWWLVAKPSTFVHCYGDKPYIAHIWIRGLCYSISIITAYYAFIRLPVGDATAIWHQAPILTAIIACAFLKEKLPKTTPFIVVMAVCGTCFITQPTFLTSHLSDNEQHVQPLPVDGVISIICSLVTLSIAVILVRAAKNAHFIQLEIVSSGETTFISVPFIMTFNQFILHNAMIGDWNFADNPWSFDARSITILCLLGVFGFAALSLNVIGFQYGDATRVAWMEYTIILVSYFYQVFMFNDVPNRFEVIGLIFVFLSCCLNLFEEMYYNYRKKDVVSTEPQFNPQSDLYDSTNKGLHVNM